ncbi:MAG: F0F1 ATP synthase subunit C [Candidatus Dadabacteria bacterium]|nr:MAG: F0F1 ATP synthase subunit C [Candidatus Dadabacteria bacterium]
MKIKSLLTFMLVSVLIPSLAFAEDGSGNGLVALGAGIAIGLAALGGTLGQGKLVSSNLDSIGRNPSAAGKMLLSLILGLVFVESLVIFSFVIAFSLQGKV